MDDLKHLILAYMESHGIAELSFEFSAYKAYDQEGRPFREVDFDVQDVVRCD